MFLVFLIQWCPIEAFHCGPENFLEAFPFPLEMKLSEDSLFPSEAVNVFMLCHTVCMYVAVSTYVGTIQ